MLYPDQKLVQKKLSQKHFILLTDLGYAQIFRHETKNILMVRYSESAVIDGKEAEEIVSQILRHRDKDKPLYGITEATIGSTVTDEARTYFANDKLSQEQTKFMAVVYKQLAQRLIVTLYLKFNKPKTPIKTFKSVQEALNYLETIVV